MGDYSLKALTQHNQARREGEIAARILVRSGDVADVANDKNFRAGFMAAYNLSMRTWGEFYGKSAAQKDAALANSELETGRGEPSQKPGDSKRRTV
jgi:hypothetical protein